MTTPEDLARQEIDRLLTQAGWVVCDPDSANIVAHRGLAIRAFPLKSGHGFADYLLYVDGRAAGVIEAKAHGTTLTGVEVQSAKYTSGLPDTLPAWERPQPFAYQSTGVETRFTNGLDPQPRSRHVFAFHRPESLAEWLAEVATPHGDPMAAETAPAYGGRHGTVLARIQHMPPLADKLWPPKPRAIGRFVSKNAYVAFDVRSDLQIAAEEQSIYERK